MAAYGSLSFAEQIAFFRQKVNLGTQRWDDILGAAHDRSFVVAGAAKADLLADLRAAVTKAIAQGTTLAEFRKDFEALVARHGWTGWTGEGTAAGRAWRTRIIYETNLRASYAAGRWAQIQQVKAERPYLLYRHNDNVLHPRPLHVAWDGKVIAADDPWWRTHFPPNGWGCQCRVHAVDDAYLRKLGKAGPDPAPDDGTYDYFNKVSGVTLRDIPKGIDPGWDYAPGASLNLQEFIADKAAKLPGGIAQQFVDAVAGVDPNKPAPWPLLQGTSATLDDIKRLGGERLQELLDLVTPDDRNLFPAMSDRGIRVEDMISRGGLSNAAAAWLRSEMLRRLKEVRSVGNNAFSTSNKSGKGKALADRVASKLPDEWIENANKGYLVKVVVNESPKGSLGVYYKKYFDDKASAYSARIETTSGSTAEHEFIHHVQEMDHALDALFQEEHRRRTANDPIGPLPRYGSPGKSDQYVDEYFGREYGGSTANPNGGALEVITRAYQAILGDDLKANEWFAQMLDKDHAILRLALGALFHYKP